MWVNIVSIDMTKNITIEVANQQETLSLAAGIGKHLVGGEVIELISDLGGGKTTFVKGLAAGAGSENLVKSPSFTLQNEYTAKNLSIYHLDFYRLEDPGLIKQMLQETLGEERAVVVIEWAGIVEDVLPKDRLQITIQATGLNSRRLEILVPDKLQYLLDPLN
jgi:tRNA threonylcarbamoyladenosine biosynthesis protein TsaE